MKEGYRPFIMVNGHVKISVSSNGVLFSAAAVKRLNYSRYVNIYINNKEKLFAVEPVEKSGSISCDFYTPNKRGTVYVRWNNKDLLHCLSSMMNWNLSDHLYEIMGYFDYANRIVEFDLKTAVRKTWREKKGVAMREPKKSLADSINTFTYHRICPEDCMDALLYMKLLKSITDACHENGIRSIFGIMLPNPEDSEASLDFRDFVVQNPEKMKNKEISCSEMENKPLTLDEMKRMIGKPVFAYDLWYGLNFWHIIKDIDDKFIYFENNGQWPIDKLFCEEPSHVFLTQERENA